MNLLSLFAIINQNFLEYLVVLSAVTEQFASDFGAIKIKNSFHGNEIS